MNIVQFIADLEENFDDFESGHLLPETRYQDIEEWSSMYALIVIAMADTEYDVVLTGEDLSTCQTVRDLFELIKSRT